MPLNLEHVSAQVEGMSASLQSQSARRLRHIEQAVAALRSIGADACHSSPPPPEDHRTIAVDGSHIDVNRHMPVRCALINISKVVLQYGASAYARLESHPKLYASPEELFIRDPDSTDRRPLEGALMGMRRTVEEVTALAELAEDTRDVDDTPTLALIDGSLGLWDPAFSTYPDYVHQSLLERGILSALDRMRALAAKRPLALAAYVSLPRSTTVLNTLPLGHLPQDEVSQLTDRDIFQQVLSSGERSNLFESTSLIVREHYGGHAVYFYYLNTGDEIARVEVPAWIAQDDAMLELSHTLILDQCRKGFGYPIALMEAHEQAVIGGAERETFRQMVEDSLAQHHLPVYTSQKDRSKTLRLL